MPDRGTEFEGTKLADSAVCARAPALTPTTNAAARANSPALAADTTTTCQSPRLVSFIVIQVVPLLNPPIFDPLDLPLPGIIPETGPKHKQKRPPKARPARLKCCFKVASLALLRGSFPRPPPPGPCGRRHWPAPSSPSWGKQFVDLKSKPSGNICLQRAQSGVCLTPNLGTDR